MEYKLGHLIEETKNDVSMCKQWKSKARKIECENILVILCSPRLINVCGFIIFNLTFLSWLLVLHN